MLAVTQSAKYVRRAVGILLVLGGTATTGMAQNAAVPPDQFHVGDRVALTVEGPAAIADTFVVRDGLILRVPTIGDISLKGVRRSDTQTYLAQEIGKQIKNPIVHAVPLIRVALSGDVGHPGYYSVPSDALLSDVIMRAGGPTPNADLSKTVVRRDGREIIGKAQVNAGLTAGKTLDDMQIAPGDEILVGEKSQQNLESLLRISGVLIGLAGVVLTLATRH